MRLVLLVGSMLLLAGCWCGGSERYDRPAARPAAKPASDPMTDVCTYCQILVEKRLKNPADAEHAWCPEGTLTNDGLTYRFSNYVDSINGFGAKVRTHYVCVVEATGGDNYSFVSVDFR